MPSIKNSELSIRSQENIFRFHCMHNVQDFTVNFSPCPRMSNQDLQDLFQGSSAAPFDATADATDAVINALASVFPEYDIPPQPAPMALKGPAKEKRPRGKEGPEISKPTNPQKRGATKDTGVSAALEDMQRKRAEK